MENQTSVFGNDQPRPLPNATAVLVLGILSIVGCLCYGIPGLILSIIALVLYNKDIQLYKINPTLYTEASYSNLKAGRICAIVGLIPSILLLIFVIIIMFTAGVGMLTNWSNF
ncbi:MAG: hypothetical protein KIT80_09595 [Chitinophagaceae bacterium]|nr:hypothetical protein [Chitinophagaceae bacterium]MCW5927153.1 hypothetical protein [Chitinophagaceae bacterium]